VNTLTDTKTLNISFLVAAYMPNLITTRDYQCRCCVL